MTLKEITIILLNAKVFFHSLELTEEHYRAWHAKFSDEDPRVFNAAMNALILQEGRVFFPTPGEVQLQLAVMKRKKQPPAGEVFEQLRKYAAAGLTLEDVRKKAAKFPAVVRALRQIDWSEYQYGDLETMPYRRRDFILLYNQCVEDYEAEARGQEALEHQGVRELVDATAKAMKRIQ